jgi:hypothetical protein
MDNEISESDLYGDEDVESGEGMAEDGEVARKEDTDVSEDEGSSSGEEKPEEVKKEKKVKVFEDKYFEVDNDPPKLVVVQGPPKSGKTTLIKSLIKHFTKQTISDPKGNNAPKTGPITVRTGKKQRITLYECPNDVGSMLDMANIADIVLMTIDGSIGFEMQTFEFLSMLQIKGFPKCMGILTHLDLYKVQSALRRTIRSWRR